MPRKTNPSRSCSPTSYHSEPSSGKMLKEDMQAKDTKNQQLEEYAQLYFKYLKLMEEQGAAMRHDVEGLYAAHATVSAEVAEEQRNLLPNALRTPEQFQQDLKELERQCHIVPQSFEDRIRIIFAANTYVRIMMDWVVDDSDKHFVLVRGCQLLREDIRRQKSQTEQSTTTSSPIPSMSRAKVELTPAHKVTRVVADQDIAGWRSVPSQLVGKGFISGEVVRRVFVVIDFAVKQIKGPQYDVVYEDSGMDDILVVDPDTLVEMITEAELITNM